MELSLFQEIGLSESKAKETAKNAKVSANLTTVINLAKKSAHKPSQGLPSVGSLLYHVASKAKTQIFHHAPLIVDHICSGKIGSESRLDAALDYLLKNPDDKVDLKAFESSCGVGVVISPEEIEKAVEKAISKEKSSILERRYRFNFGAVMSEVRRDLPWADGKMVKSEVDMQVLDLLGPKTAEDLAPQPKVAVAKETKATSQTNAAASSKAGEANKKTKGPANANAAVNGVAAGDAGEGAEDGAATIAELMKTKVNFHKPGANFTTDGYVLTDHTKRLLAEHLKRTGGKVFTRFPPEPNGLLHIGHAKAININFGYAAAHGGHCYLRYDDTNPEKEEEKFFTGIRDIVEWLGYKPHKITHSSDNFQQLYEWAKELVVKGHAYVCHQKVEDIRGFNPPPSPWRDRPSSESLQLFEDMKNGKFDEGEATLRLKVTLEEGKQDPVAYRIKYAAHHRTGDDWCVYPTYDYTHCLCDSIEDITHSLCTKEFQNRRSSYYWLCNALDIYCPVQWEYGRLNVSYTVVSKRKIAKLISSGICSDWDDPRLFTLSALRRRGFPAEAINNFCARMGVTGATMVVDPSMLEAIIRSHLNVSAARTMVVLEPLKVNITNLVSGVSYNIDVPDFPDSPDKGSHKIAFSSTIYIERSDFREDMEKGYRRLTKDQTVGLRYTGYVIRLVKVHKSKSGDVTEIDVECVPVDEAKEKPKAFVHWVAEPVEIEVRLYERLFKHKNPEDPVEVPGGFLNDVNLDSRKVLKSFADKYFVGTKGSPVKVLETFQFERQGFFCVDTDSSLERIVFNRTVSLKEDAKKI